MEKEAEHVNRDTAAQRAEMEDIALARVEADRMWEEKERLQEEKAVVKGGEHKLQGKKWDVHGQLDCIDRNYHCFDRNYGVPIELVQGNAFPITYTVRYRYLIY